MKVAEGDIDTKSQIGVLLSLAIVKSRTDQGLDLNPALVPFDPTTSRVSRSALCRAPPSRRQQSWRWHFPRPKLPAISSKVVSRSSSTATTCNREPRINGSHGTVQTKSFLTLRPSPGKDVREAQTAAGTRTKAAAAFSFQTRWNSPVQHLGIFMKPNHFDPP